MDSRIPVKLANVHQVVTLTIPQDELLLLFLVPEFKNLVSRFRNKIKVQCAAEPCQLFISMMVVPFFLNTRSDFIGMVRLRNSLEHLPPPKSKMKQHG